MSQVILANRRAKKDVEHTKAFVVINVIFTQAKILYGSVLESELVLFTILTCFTDALIHLAMIAFVFM